MADSTWISLKYSDFGSSVEEFDEELTSLIERPLVQIPSLITLVGKSEKSLFLQELGCPNRTNERLLHPHGHVRVWGDSETRRDYNPLIYFDCEVQNKKTSNNLHMYKRVGSIRTIVSTQAQQASSYRQIGNLLCSRVLSPISFVICYFVKDCGGLQGVARFIAENASEKSTSDLPQSTLPCVIVVTDTQSQNFSPKVTEGKLTSLIY